MEFEKTQPWKSLWPLALSAIAATAATLMARWLFRYQGIETDLGSWNSFFAVFGVVYAIIAGFLLVTVLSRYTTIAQVCEEELNAIECLRDFLVYLDDQQEERKRGLRRSLTEYVESVADREWVEMSGEHASIDSDTSAELYAIMRACRSFEATRPIEETALASLMDTIAELTKLRTRRIALATQRLPPRLRLLLGFMSLVLVLGFAVLGAVQAILHVAMALTVALSVHLLFLIIEDLDHPFYGVWNIDRAPLVALAARLEGRD